MDALSTHVRSKRKDRSLLPAPHPEPLPPVRPLPTPAESSAAGKALRDKVARADHASLSVAIIEPSV